MVWFLVKGSSQLKFRVMYTLDSGNSELIYLILWCHRKRMGVRSCWLLIQSMPQFSFVALGNSFNPFV